MCEVMLYLKACFHWRSNVSVLLSYKVMAQVILNEVKFSQQFLLSKFTVNTLELLIF